MEKQRLSTDKPVELDGRTLEGGGQLVRNALCLSALTGVPVLIQDIRGNRSGGGGLKSQHLACVNWLANACSARVTGAEKGSKQILFEPGKADEAANWTGHSPAYKKVMRNAGPVYECKLEIGTAGSTGLALQAILPFILYSTLPSAIPVRLTLSGGTNVSGSPSYEYISQVLLPTLHCIGFPQIKAELGKRGWSHGGSSIGNFTLEIQPRGALALPPFELRPSNKDVEPPRLVHLQATFIAPSTCRERAEAFLTPAIQKRFGSTFSLENENLELIFESSLHEKRMYFILVATLASSSAQIEDVSTPARTYKLARDWLYDRKITSHERAMADMIKTVVDNLATELATGALVDSHMRDQLIIFQALAQGRSEVFAGVDERGGLVEPSLHVRTAEFVSKNMLQVTFNAEGRCEGVGFGGEDEPSNASGEESVESRFERLDIKQ